MTEQYLLTAVPAALRSELQASSLASKRSVTAIVGGVLAERYGLFLDGDGHRSGPAYEGGEKILLRLPPAVMNAVRKEADLRHLHLRSVILEALAGEFGLDTPPARKVRPESRPGRKRKHGRPRGRKAKA